MFLGTALMYGVINHYFRFELAEVWKLQEFERGWGYVSWLPCAHVFGQLVD